MVYPFAELLAERNWLWLFVLQNIAAISAVRQPRRGPKWLTVTTSCGKLQFCQAKLYGWLFFFGRQMFLRLYQALLSVRSKVRLRYILQCIWLLNAAYRTLHPFYVSWSVFQQQCLAVLPAALLFGKAVFKYVPGEYLHPR